MQTCAFVKPVSPLPISSIPLAWILGSHHHLNFAGCISQSPALLHYHPSFIWEVHTHISKLSTRVGEEYSSLIFQSSFQGFSHLGWE